MDFQTTDVHIKNFQEMSLAPYLLTALEKIGILTPTEIQEQAIPAILEGSDLIAVAQTGSGKTLAFLLSILTLLDKKPEARALILTPTREMAQQIHKVFLELTEGLVIPSCMAIGGIPSEKQLSKFKKNPRVIVATPGRLNDHLVTNKTLLQNVEFIIIDEADRMLDMGFAPQLENIHSTLRGSRQNLMFAASFSPEIESIAKLFMTNKIIMIRTAQAEEPVIGLSQKVLLIERKMKKERLLDELNATKGGVIVFTGSQESCEIVGQHLKDYGFEADLIHSGLTQGNRNRVVKEFRDGDIRILVTTDLLARGLDVSHVEHIINYDLPYSSEDFLHRIGRTARAGRLGSAISFVTETDGRMYEKIKIYLQEAETMKINPNFEFIELPKKTSTRVKKDSTKISESSKKFGSYDKSDSYKKPFSSTRPGFSDSTNSREGSRRPSYTDRSANSQERSDSFRRPERSESPRKFGSFNKPSDSFRKPFPSSRPGYSDSTNHREGSRRPSYTDRNANSSQDRPDSFRRPERSESPRKFGSFNKPSDSFRKPFPSSRPGYSDSTNFRDGNRKTSYSDRNVNSQDRPDSFRRPERSESSRKFGSFNKPSDSFRKPYPSTRPSYSESPNSREGSRGPSFSDRNANSPQDRPNSFRRPERSESPRKFGSFNKSSDSFRKPYPSTRPSYSESSNSREGSRRPSFSDRNANSPQDRPDSFRRPESPKKFGSYNKSESYRKPFPSTRPGFSEGSNTRGSNEDAYYSNKKNVYQKSGFKKR